MIKFNFKKHISNISVLKKVFIMSNNKKVVAKNFFSLSALQVINNVIPFITIPYLIRVIGPEKFGLFAFAQSFIQYFVIFTDYGFNLSATREISIHKDDSSKVTDIFNSVLTIKALFTLFSFVILLSTIAVFAKFQTDYVVYLLYFGAVLGAAIYPIWFYQGIEKMKYLLYLNIIPVLFTVSIFMFVRSEDHYMRVPLISFLSSIITGICGLLLAYKKFGIKLSIPRFSQLKHEFSQGWHVFISNIGVAGYTNTRIFVVGLIAGNVITGYYAVAEKIIALLILFPLGLLLQAAYPRLSKIFSENAMVAENMTKRLQDMANIFYMFITLVMYIFAPHVVRVMCGAPYYEAMISLRILLIGMFFIAANAFRVHFLLICGKSNIFARIHVFMGVFGAFLTILATYYFSYIGTASSVIVIEIMVLCLTIWHIKKYGYSI